MKILQNKPVTALIIVMAVLLTGIYALLGIPSGEGFNPSDDGVILAQSYRLLNGEIPHLDFISIRPAGSAVMHMIHFFSPLPLELSARWMVLFEYFIYSMVLVLILTGSWFRGIRKELHLLLVAGSVLVMFILNQNHYNLFPWTTIDGLFWFTLALYAWYRLKTAVTGISRRWLVVLFFSVTFSLLSRQTFVLPGILLVIRMFIWEVSLSEKPWYRVLTGLLPAALTGLVPGLIYLGVLTLSGAWPEFIRQMTGRTEFWETGIVRFAHSFWQSPLLLLFGLSVITGLIKTWNTESGRDSFRIDMVIMVEKAVSFFAKIVMVFLVFIKPEWLFGISHGFFWILVLDISLIYQHDQQLPRWLRPAFWVLLIAWTSAISLGDNAPVFATGWLAGTALLMQVRDFGNRIYRKVRPYQLVAAGLLVPALLVLSLVVQGRVNYRDLPAGRLTVNGGELFPGLEGIRLSPGMDSYLSDISRLYDELGRPRGRFAVWPNNALIYPLLDSENPFPLDWMQAAEYAGSEARIMESTRSLLQGEDLIILVEKMNVKWIATGEVPVDHRSPDYTFLPLLDSLARLADMESRWFNVYRTK